MRLHRVGLIGGPDWPKQWRPCALRSFEVEDVRRDRKAYIEAKQGAVDAHPSDGEFLQFSDLPSRGVYLTFIL
jgi:hypothetical protein